MNRRSLLRMAPMASIALYASRLFGAPARAAVSPADVRNQALRLQELASGIHEPADAQRLIDFLATVFTDDLPPAWTTRSLRQQIALVEYTSATDPAHDVTEQRIADVWNAYVDSIGAPDGACVRAVEVHYLRDSFLTSARIFWDRDHRTIWTVPAIYATQPDGSLAPGCRAIEAIRILWDLANMPDNLTGARQRVATGILLSEQVRRDRQKPASASKSSVRMEVRSYSNPVEAAARQFIRDNGLRKFNELVVAMLDGLFTA